MEPTIQKCMDSIVSFIEKNSIQDWEIIYSDSNSNDGTLKLVRNYQVTIVHIEGNLNAAIGRNEGAKIAEGDVLFFIDGDMELITDCYDAFFRDESNLIYPFLRGAFVNVFYTSDFKRVIKEQTFKNGNSIITEYLESKMTGGLFAITAENWKKLNGMDERFDSNQDVDFGLRMSAQNINQRIYHNILMAKHHTVDYYDKERLLTFLKSTRLLCPGMLIRKHLTNRIFWPFILRSRYSLFFLIFTISAIIISWKTAFICIVLYTVIQIVRTLRVEKLNNSRLSIFLYKVFYDLYSIIGFAFFHPREKKYKVSLENIR